MIENTIRCHLTPERQKTSTCKYVEKGNSLQLVRISAGIVTRESRTAISQKIKKNYHTTIPLLCIYVRIYMCIYIQ